MAIREQRRAQTIFWVKDVNYALLDLFGGQRQWAKLFEGGQIYQGFLSATHYHRWRAPLDGTLVRSWVQPGTYFAQRPGQGEDSGTWEGTQSEPYLGHVAPRHLHLRAQIMRLRRAHLYRDGRGVDVCDRAKQFRRRRGDEPVSITRDTEIGHFEFGGSTHIMVFQKDRVRLEDWAVKAEMHQNDPQPTPMGSIIATASR